MSYNNRCPRCGEERLRTWDELSEDEQEIVKRLPASVEYTAAERTTHRWCTRCWFEATEDTEKNA
jgi:hypothetical protein